MTDATPTSRRSWWKPALMASLAANLFLIGLIGGQALLGPDEEEKRPPTSRGYSLHPRVMMEALPEDRHDDIRAYWAEARKGMGQQWRGINTIRREIDATLRAEPFDEEAMRAAQRREVEARADLRNKQNDDVAAFFATLSAEDRNAIADLALQRLEERSAYWRERARKRREKEGQ